MLGRVDSSGPSLCPFCRSDLLSIRPGASIDGEISSTSVVIREPSPIPVWWNENPQLPVDDAVLLYEEAPPSTGLSSSGDANIDRSFPEVSRVLDTSILDNEPSNVLCITCDVLVGPLDFQVSCRAGHTRHIRCVVDRRSSCPACCSDEAQPGTGTVYSVEMLGALCT